MTRSRMAFFQVLACCISTLACHHTDSQRDYPPPTVTSYRMQSLVLDAGDTSHTVRGAFVKPEFFKLVRDQPLVGRYFYAEDHQPGNQGVVVLSHGLWQERFGADLALIGKGVVLDGRSYTIVGVMPKGVNAPEGTDVCLPEAASGR